MRIVQLTISAFTSLLKMTSPGSVPNLFPRILTCSPGVPALGKMALMYGLGHGPSSSSAVPIWYGSTRLIIQMAKTKKIYLLFMGHLLKGSCSSKDLSFYTTVTHSCTSDNQKALCMRRDHYFLLSSDLPHRNCPIEIYYIVPNGKQVLVLEGYSFIIRLTQKIEL